MSKRVFGSLEENLGPNLTRRGFMRALMTSAGVLALPVGAGASSNGIHSDGTVGSSRRYSVVLVDASYDSFPDRGGVFQLEQELENMGEVLGRANELGIPVFETTFHPNYLSKLGANPEDYRTDPYLGGKKDDNWKKILKWGNSPFKRTDFSTELSDKGITDAVLMGFNQGVCVRETAKGLNDRGINVHTSFDVLQGDGRIDYVVKWSIEAKARSKGYDISEPTIRSVIDQLVQEQLRGVPNPESELVTRDVIAFYEQNTNLVENYRQLPIFNF